MKLLLIRHGESRGNASRRWQGWLDEPLTDRGREQAHRLAERLHSWSAGESEPPAPIRIAGITAVYSSTLARAHQTASILARRWGVPLVLDGRLRERNVGALQGLTWPEIETHHPHLAQTIRQRWTMPALPDGEATSDLAERVWQATQEIILRADGHQSGGSVAIVSHGGALNAYFNRLIGRDDDMPFLFRLGNTSLSVVEFQNGRPRILLVNELCHLE